MFFRMKLPLFGVTAAKEANRRVAFVNFASTNRLT
jgi:hypothetical protein